MTEKTYPTVSVVMKVYNGEEYLREAIDSILAQTYKEFELVVIDDGSVDGSAEIVRSYQDERIRFLQNEKNLGLCETQNKVIAAARGKYIAVMDCDDISYPTRLMEQVTYLDAHPKTMMCGTFRKNIINGKESVFIEPEELDDATLQFSLVFGNYYFTHSSIMFRAKEYREHGFSYGPSPIAEDYAIILQMAARFEIAMIPKCLVGYRINPKSISHTKEREITREALRIKSHYLAGLSLINEGKDLLRPYFETGISYRPVEDFIKGMHLAAKALWADVSPNGNAYSTAQRIMTEYILHFPNYDLQLWKELRRSSYKNIVSLKKIFGWRIFMMCLLRYRRDSYAK